jgi:hydrogenase expression/formation protein HypC
LFDDQGPWAIVDVLGARRRISMELLVDDFPDVGDWVLIHVGFALSKISGQEAKEQLELLSQLGQADEAHEELGGDVLSRSTS